MNSGVLQFTLGLATGGFLGPLNSVGAKLTGFIGGLVSLGAISEGVMSAIERGAALEHLSKRTDTSVASLYQLQEGFKAVGLDADAVGPVIFKMQKALGGVNEYGEDTKSVFHRMGLSIDALKRMNAPQQIQAIATGLGRLNSTSAASAAGGIFGREGAGQMVQLANSTKEFAEAMFEAQENARLFGKNAEAFSKLEQHLREIKSRVEGMFAGIAEGLAPAIEAIEDSINTIDLTPVGEQIGKVLTAFTEAFREGKVSELIALSVSTGLEAGFAIAPALFEEIGYLLLEAFKTPLMYLQAGFTWVEEKMIELVASIESKLPKGMRKAIGFDESMTGFKADSFDKILQDRKDQGLELGNSSLGEIKAQKDKDLKAAIAKIKKIFEPLGIMVNGLAARAPKGAGEGLDDVKKKESLEPSNHYKPEVTAFEKMGFVMGGRANPMKRSEDLLSNINAGIQKLIQKPTLGDLPGMGIANQL